MAESFPLDWPEGWNRTLFRKPSKFRETTFLQAREALMAELARIRAIDVVVSTNVPLRRDGNPASAKLLDNDPGVAVYFRMRGQPRVIPCDRWQSVADNLHAVELWLEAQRGQLRWVNEQTVERTFEGFTALPAPPPGPEPELAWWDVLGVDQGEDLSIIEAVYRARLKKAHPDVGGDSAQAARLTNAINDARRSKNGAKE